MAKGIPLMGRDPGGKAKMINEMCIRDSYYKGNQPILNRVKQVREEINNKIVENHAMEIVDFKKGYVFGEPVQYVRRGEHPGVADKIGKLNEFMFAEDKASKDQELAEWFYICGTGYRMILPDEDADPEADRCV